MSLEGRQEAYAPVGPGTRVVGPTGLTRLIPGVLETGWVQAGQQSASTCHEEAGIRIVRRRVSRHAVRVRESHECRLRSAQSAALCGGVIPNLKLAASVVYEYYISMSCRIV